MSMPRDCGVPRIVKASVTMTAKAAAAPKPTRLISWNLLHRGGAQVAEVAELIAREKPDALLMQEATAELERVTELAGGAIVRTPLPGRRHGLAVWTPHEAAVPAETFDLPRGAIVSRICQIVDLGAFSVANVHLSHGQRLNRLQLHYISGRLPARAAIMGDFNLVGPALLEGFRDVGLRRHTHRASGLLRLRLDRCLIRDLDCTGAQVLARGASDHHPILVTLEPASEIRQKKPRRGVS
ncbi:MAG: endonuclease/exonuclease/phosphatase family protein [Micropepsaceae bacterium]